MALYKSICGRDVTLKINDKYIVIHETPTEVINENLDFLFPKHIIKIDNENNNNEINNIKIEEKTNINFINNNKNVFDDRKFYYLDYYFKDNIWLDNRCFIIGGGPSLLNFDFSCLRKEKIIVLNKAFVSVPFADIMFAIDYNLIFWLKFGGKNMDEAVAKYKTFSGLKVFLDKKYIYPKDVLLVKDAGLEGISTSLENGIYHGGNAGYAGINLAICLKANPIYLLGFDMYHEKGITHFHGGYPYEQDIKQLELFKERFTFLAEEAKKKNIKIINLNKKSNLKCFDFDDIDNVLKEKVIFYNNNDFYSNKKWILISFYTKDTGYEDEIKKLEFSLKKFKINYYFFAYDKLKNWRENLNYKSKCILEAMEMFKDKDIVFCDSDAIIEEYPELFDFLSNTYEYDIAYNVYKYSLRSGDSDELLSGTLWIKNTEKVKNLIKLWHKIGLDYQNVRHQKCLKIAINTLNNYGYNINSYLLPFEYVYIFDYKYPEIRKPIIQHFQASRRFKKNVGYGENLLTTFTPEISLDYIQNIFNFTPKINYQIKNKENNIVDVIILFHNNLDDITIRCLESLDKYTKNFKLILVSNGANDDVLSKVVKFINKTNIDTILIKNEKNLGYPKAINIALKYTTAKYIALVNDDIIFYSNWLDKFVSYLENNEDVGIVSGLTDTLSANYYKKFIDITKYKDKYDLFDYHNNLELLTKEIVEKSIPFNYVLIRRKLFEEIEDFISEDFGIGYGEDNWACFLALQHNYKIVLLLNVLVHHEHSKTFKSVLKNDELINLRNRNKKVLEKKIKKWLETKNNK